MRFKKRQAFGLLVLGIGAMAVLLSAQTGLDEPWERAVYEDQPYGSIQDKAEGKAEPIVIGTALSLPSKAFGQPIRLQVALPAGYEAGQAGYPVLIAFQVADRFPAIAGIAAGLASAGAAPSLIVVSVELNGDLFSLYADERKPGSGRGPDVLEFVRRELVPFLEARFRTVPYRILLGHSASALWGLQVAMLEPDLFQTVLSAGPMFAEADYARVSELLDKALAARKSAPQYLLFTQGDQPELTRDLAAFQDWLKARRPAGLIWEFDPEPGESHGSLAMMTLYDGLRELYKPWANLPEDIGLGGGPAIRGYKKALAGRFGYDIGLAPNADFRLRVKWTEERRFEPLIALARFGCEDRPEDWYAVFSLGMSLGLAGRWTEAAASYETALTKLGGLPAAQAAAIRPRIEARLAEARKKTRGQVSTFDIREFGNSLSPTSHIGSAR